MQKIIKRTSTLDIYEYEDETVQWFSVASVDGEASELSTQLTEWARLVQAAKTDPALDDLLQKAKIYYELRFK